MRARKVRSIRRVAPSSNRRATARWNHIFSNKLFLNLTGYYSNYDYSIESDRKDKNAKDKFTWNSKIISTSLKPDFTYYLTPNNQVSFG